MSGTGAYDSKGVNSGFSYQDVVIHIVYALRICSVGSSAGFMFMFVWRCSVVDCFHNLLDFHTAATLGLQLL